MKPLPVHCTLPGRNSIGPDVGPGLAPLPAGAPWMRGLPWFVGLVALAPFLIWRERFAELFWFADDLFLTDQIAQMGFLKWTGQFFGENFAPLFKLLWGGALLAFDGSYAAMLWLLWLTHALNTALWGRLLWRVGFPRTAVILAQIVFALTPVNLETLGWSVQWSALLAVTFLLLGLLWHEKHGARAAAWNWRAHVPLVLFAAASACCCSRGVLTGGVLALAVLAPLVPTRDRPSWHPRLPAALLCLLPAVTVAAIIMLFAGGNQRHMSGHWGEALEFSLAYLLLNPGHLLLGEPHLGSVFSLLLGALKLVVIILGLAGARGRVRAAGIVAGLRPRQRRASRCRPLPHRLGRGVKLALLLQFPARHSALCRAAAGAGVGKMPSARTPAPAGCQPTAGQPGLALPARVAGISH